MSSGTPRADCSSEIGRIWAQQASTPQATSVEVTFINAVQQGLACLPVARQVSGLLDEAPPPPATFASEIRPIAQRIGTGLLDDALRNLERLVLAVR